MSPEYRLIIPDDSEQDFENYLQSIDGVKIVWKFSEESSQDDLAPGEKLKLLTSNLLKFGFSKRVHNAIARGVDLENMDVSMGGILDFLKTVDLPSIRNLGEKGISEIAEKLKSLDQKNDPA